MDYMENFALWSRDLQHLLHHDAERQQYSFLEENRAPVTEPESQLTN